MKIWVIKLFKHFFFTLDSVLFNFIPTIYDLLISISRTTIFSQAQIHEFASRIQMLLGIFMLFKVSFSLIMYVVNPDDFSDKSKGIGKLAQNTVISLIMLAVVPYIFNMAFKLQVMVLEDNTLARLILGDANQKKDLSYINKAGDTMAFYTFVPFFLPNTAIQLDDKEADMVNCVSLTDPKTGDFNNDCLVALNIAFGENEGENVITSEDSLEKNLEKAGTTTVNYVQGIRRENIGLLFRINALSATYTPENSEEDFVIQYNWPITTAVAIVVLLVLLNYCIDVALRSVKLAFLQLISPIPIISYMDPKSGKDGMFSKWAKMCMSTYISLFVRLLALYFGVYIITQVGEMYDVVNGSVIDNFFVKVFIIIGVLMFIKQLPKILENMGIKLDGDGKFTLNPFKKIGEGAIGMKKPMENLHKNGYGIGLGAKKIISGIDSAKHGKGFFNGARKIEGAGAFSKARKWYRDITPNRTEELNKSREAKADLNYKKKLYNKGEKINNMDSKMTPGKTVKENVSARKSDIAALFTDVATGQAQKIVDKNELNNKFEELGKALVEQYGGNTAKNREYARISVEKIAAELEMRRLNAIQRQSYDPVSGEFKNTGAYAIDGKTELDSVEALESAIEAQQKKLESLGEYASKEKDFQYNNAAIDTAVATRKGVQPRRDDFKPSE